MLVPMDVPAPPLDPVALAILLMFGSLLAGIAVGALVGWRTRFETGAAIALLSLAAGGLGGAARVAYHYRVETAVVTLPRSACTERQTLDRRGRARPMSTDLHVLLLPDGRELTLVTPEQGGDCSQTEPIEPRRLRYRLADAARGSGTVVAAEVEPDDRSAEAVPWVFAAFGGFGLLAGLFFVATVLGDRRRQRLGAAADAAPPVGPGRRRLAGAFNAGGSLTVLGAFAATVVTDEDAAWSTQWLFAAIAAACLLYGLGFAARRQLRADTALMLMIIGGGFAAAAWSVHVLG